MMTLKSSCRILSHFAICTKAIICRDVYEVMANHLQTRVSRKQPGNTADRELDLSSIIPIYYYLRLVPQDVELAASVIEVSLVAAGLEIHRQNGQITQALASPFCVFKDGPRDPQGGSLFRERVCHWNFENFVGHLTAGRYYPR